MFFELPVITFPVFVQYLVIQTDGFPVDTVSFFVTIYQANIFGEKPKFKSFIFGEKLSFQI
jgi:hypothetical protein